MFVVRSRYLSKRQRNRPRFVKWRKEAAQEKKGKSARTELKVE